MAKKYTLSDDLKNTFTDLEQQHNLPSGLLSAVAKTESNYNPSAQSPVGASGMFQFMPGTAKQYGVNTSDPVSSARGAAKMYADLLKANGGDLNKALAGYNWGQGNVQKKGLERAPTETRNYISRVKQNLNYTDYNNIQTAGGDGATATLNNGSNNAKPQFDTNAFSLDDLDSQEQSLNNQTNNAESNQAVDTTNPNDPKSGAITNQFDTNAFSLDDLDQDPSQAQPQTTKQQQQAVQQPVVNAQQAEVKPRQYDEKDKALIENLGSHKNMGEFLAQIKDSDLQNGTNQYQEIMNSLQRYGQANPQAVDHGWFRTLAGSVANGLNSFKNSAGQWVTRAIGDEESYKNFQNNEKQQEALIDANNALDDRSGTRLTGQIIGESLPTLAVPGGLVAKGVSKLGKAGEAVATALNTTRTGRIASSAAQGAVGSAVGDGSTANYDDFLEDRAKNAAVGAVVAPAVGGVINTVARPVAKLIAGRTPEEARLAQQEAQRNGIQLLNSDLPGISEKGKAISEAAVKDNTAVQQQIIKNADTAKDQLKTLADKASTFDDVAFVNKRPALKEALTDVNNSYADEAKKYMDYVGQIDNKHDPISALKTVSMGQNLDKKIQASNLYNKAWDSIPNDTNNLMNAELTENALNSFKNLANKSYDKNQTKELMSVYNRFSGNDLTRFDPRDIDDFRKALNSVSNDYASNPIANKSANTQILNQISKVKDALDADTDNFANSINNKDFVKNYKVARAFYAKNVVPLNDGKNAKLFSIDYNNNPNALTTLLKDPYNTKTVMKMLDDEGKQAVQAGALNTLINKSMKDDIFNPESFIKSYNSYQKKDSGLNPLDEVFGGTSGVGQRVKNLSKIMGNMTSTTTAGKTPQNGYEVYKLLVKHAPKFAGAIGAGAGLGAGGIAGAALAGAGSAVASKVLKNTYAKILTKPEYSKFMFDFAQTNPKSDHFLKKADKFISILSANGLNEINED